MDERKLKDVSDDKNIREIIGEIKDDIPEQIKQLQKDDAENTRIIDRLESMEQTVAVREELRIAYEQRRRIDERTIELLWSKDNDVTSMAQKVNDINILAEMENALNIPDEERLVQNVFIPNSEHRINVLKPYITQEDVNSRIGELKQQQIEDVQNKWEAMYNKNPPAAVVEEALAAAESLEPEFEPEVIDTLAEDNMSKIPKDWYWTHYEDGSGGLHLPDGTQFVSYDLQTGEWWFYNYNEMLGLRPKSEFYFDTWNLEDVIHEVEYRLDWAVDKYLTKEMRQGLGLVETKETRFFDEYDQASPIINDYKNYVVIHRSYSEKNIVENEVLYNPHTDTFMFVDTSNDIYLTYENLAVVKKFMTQEEIDKFQAVSKGFQIENPNNNIINDKVVTSKNSYEAAVEEALAAAEPLEPEFEPEM